jgi:long-chain acyl-CoA synthetase
MNVGAFLRRTAARRPDAPAIRFGERSWSFRELDARVDALATGLERRCGARRGDRVVVWMNNGPEVIETFFACWKLGLVVVPVNARLHPDEVAFHARDCGAIALVHGSEYAAGAAGVEVSHRIVVRGDGPLGYEDIVAAGAGAPDRTVALPDEAPAWLFYTSGTTGRPKGATLTHGNLTYVVLGWCADLHCVQPEDVVLHCAPLSHGAGFLALTAVARGAESVVLPRFEAAAALRAIEAHRVTATWMVPTQIRLILDEPTLAERDLSSLTHLVYGGSPIHLEDLTEAVERLGPVLCQLYGQGETPMTISWLRREEHRLDRPDREVLASAGLARTGIEIAILDEAGGALPAGKVGQIAVRGPTVMAGYWQRPEATAETLKDGWLWTGDLGRLDERGYLYVLDRTKDLIITGGANVYAREVEDVLVACPGVRDAAVFGVRHRVWGEAVTAAVVGSGALDEAAILAFCRERLAGYKCPKRVHLVDTLPRSAYGKVLKRELRERFTGS